MLKEILNEFFIQKESNLRKKPKNPSIDKDTENSNLNMTDHLNLIDKYGILHPLREYTLFSRVMEGFPKLGHKTS